MLVFYGGCAVALLFCPVTLLLPHTRPHKAPPPPSPAPYPPFPRFFLLSDVPPLPCTHTSFPPFSHTFPSSPPPHSYADLYGRHGAMSPAETGGGRAHRVTFGHDTMFRDSLEVAATMTGSREAAGEDVRRLPGQAQQKGGGGQRTQSAPSRQQQQKALESGYQDGGGRGGGGGNRAAKAVAAAAEEAARLLSGVRIGNGGGGGQPQQRKGAAAAVVGSGAVRSRPRTAGAQAVQVAVQQSSVMGTAVRYETHIGVGGGVFTFALPSGGGGGGGGGAVTTAGARPGGRSLVSEYMSTGGNAVSAPRTQQQLEGKMPAPRQDRGHKASGTVTSVAAPAGPRSVTAGPPGAAAAAAGRHAGGARRALEYGGREG